ncbi:MAG TPA: 2Fe-2S iron-sulfur cluster-binding protein [Chitinivibrionales bacterium]|nr:2Fe-2S iron-sulfur cluster-binding protein [Chitinivibrionales bacterium]
MEKAAPDKITVTIDGRTSDFAPGTTVLNAARQMGIAIPTLCNYRGMEPIGACRVCIVELETPRGPKIVSSCNYPVESGMKVKTDTPFVLDNRKVVLELLLAQAPESKKIAEFAAGLGVASTPFAKKDGGDCILCGLCVKVCADLMGRGAIGIYGRGAGREVKPAFDEKSEQCQVCGACDFVCPAGTSDHTEVAARRTKKHATAFNQFLEARPNIDFAHPQAVPRVPSIDPKTCVKLTTGECGLCSEVCGAGAIEYEQKEATREIDVGAVLLTPGFSAFDPLRRIEYGSGYDSNVIANTQFERILSAAGPTKGHVRRPSDDTTPRRIAFIQCVGSRDNKVCNDFCSAVCCMAATKEAILTKTHEPDALVTVYYMDMRAYGKDFDRYLDRAKEMGVSYVRCRPSSVEEVNETKNLKITYVNDDNRIVTSEHDLVVLSLGLEPSASIREQAERFNVMLNQWGFANTTELSPLETSRPGVFVGGVFSEPKDIPDTVMQASAVAAKAMALLAPARGTAVKTKIYPPERDITDEPPRVGVFICHCGSNIASVVDVEAVVQSARKLPYVVLAERNTYTCADDTQDQIKEKIIKHRLNRVIVASCTPRTHEAIFRDTLRDAGLNPYLLEMANIRDQCSWVHSAEPDKATAKAKDLVRMTVGRTVGLAPLTESTVPVKGAALVIGGGLAGLTAALAIADQGFPVHLVEKENTLGGMAARVYQTLDGGSVEAHLSQAIGRVTSHPKIIVHLKSKVKKVDGHVGDFTSEIVAPETTVKVEHGVVIVATGAAEGKPQSYGYGKNPKVVTQLELSEKLGRNELSIPEKASIVMIQCVDQRNKERPYCSRVCCTSAIKNALLLRKRYPKAAIVVLYREMRTYGFREAAYKEAREKGILFVRYDENKPPMVTENEPLLVKTFDAVLGRQLQMKPDLLVLAAPIVAAEDRQEISELLRVPLNADGFFLEAHVKLRPVDFASEGLFLCGTAHAPKFIGETISQANAVAGRAATILSRKVMPVGAQTAWVDPDKCIACMTCVHVCPYLAPRIGKDNKAEVDAAVCMGCGSCTSACPAKAVSLHHYLDAQILGAINSLLAGTFEEKAAEKDYLEQVGVAQPRWKK